MIDAIRLSNERRKIWLYFFDPGVGYALVVLFLGLILVDLLLGKALLLVSLVWLGGALALETKRPSEQEVDQILIHDLKSLVQKAMHSLNPPDHEMRAPPLALYGPVELDAPAFDRLFARPRTGRDGGHRSPVTQAVILVPMEDHLGVYSCQHDSLTGLTSQVSVEEHHYRDVVTVKLEKDVDVAYHPGKEGTCPIQMFSLELTNGRRLSIPVSVAWQEEHAIEEEPLATGLDKTVLAIRALMRDKR